MFHNRSSLLLKTTAIPLCLALLAGCGGGGGGSSGSTGAGTSGGGTPAITFSPLVQLYPLSSIQTAEYYASAELNTINAAPAYAAGYTGAGIKVAVLDSGIDTDHAEFTGRIASGGRSFISGNSSIEDPLNDGHGTEVSGLIVASRDGIGMHGTAYGAQVLPLKVCLNFACGASAIISAVDYAIAQNVDIINFSLGFSSSAGVGVYEAFRRATSAGIVVVAAAGNDTTSASPIEPASLASDSNFGGLLIAAGGIDAGNNSIGNGASGAASNFVVAPGDGVTTTEAGGGYVTVSGTSFSTPTIAGAVALLLQRFPTLTPAQAVSLLLQNTTDLGAAGTDNTYGRGLINIEAAMQPAVAVGLSIPGSKQAVTLANASLGLNEAFGSTVAAGLSALPVQDGYQRTYIYDLSSRTGFAVQGVELAGVMEASALDFMGSRQQLGRGIAVTASLQQDTMGLQSGSVGKADDIPAHRTFAAEQDFGRLGTLQLGQNLMQQDTWQKDIAGQALVQPLSPAASLPFLSFVQQGTHAAWQFQPGKAWQFTTGHATGTRNTQYATRQEQGDNTLLFADLQYLAGNWKAGLTGGELQEENHLLGAWGNGSLALADTATTRFASLHGLAALGEGWFAHGRYTWGQTASNAADASFFTGTDTLSSSSWSLGLFRENLWQDNDQFFISLSQPLHITAGNAYVSQLDGLDTSGQPLTSNRAIPLARENTLHDVEVGYALKLDTRTSLSTQAWLRFDSDAAAMGRDRVEEGYMLRVQRRF